MIRKKRDPIEQTMESALKPGRFIKYDDAFEFVQGYLSVHHGRLHWTNALSSHSVKRSTGEIEDFKLAVWRSGSKTADYS